MLPERSPGYCLLKAMSSGSATLKTRLYCLEPGPPLVFVEPGTASAVNEVCREGFMEIGYQARTRLPLTATSKIRKSERSSTLRTMPTISSHWLSSALLAMRSKLVRCGVGRRA